MPNIDKRKTKETDKARTNLLKSLLNVDNQSLLLHKRELSNYIKYSNNSLIAVEVDLTLSCNHRCPSCTFGHKRNAAAHISDVLLDKLVQGLPKLGVKGMIITGGGEPCLHKNLGSFVKRISNEAIDITLTTNGQFIDRHFIPLMHNLKRMRFSIDAANYKSFSYTHGAGKKDFEQVIANLKKAVEYKRSKGLSIDIGVSFLICDKNIDELDKAIIFYQDIGADFLHFKPTQLWDSGLNRYYYKDYPRAENFISNLVRYNKDNFRVSISRQKHYAKNGFNIVYSQCHGSYFNMVIGADGKVYTCCHFKYNPKYCYGNLAHDSLADITKKVKSKIARECFIDCKMDALNQFVEYAKTHQNQILRISKDLKPGKLPLGSKWL